MVDETDCRMTRYRRALATLGWHPSNVAALTGAKLATCKSWLIRDPPEAVQTWLDNLAAMNADYMTYHPAPTAFSERRGRKKQSKEG